LSSKVLNLTYITVHGYQPLFGPHGCHCHPPTICCIWLAVPFMPWRRVDASLLSLTTINATVQGNISVIEQGMSPDKKPSTVINYANNEALVFRPLRDEMRRVCPHSSCVELLVDVCVIANDENNVFDNSHDASVRRTF
jgi:hypothetical protein